MKVDSIRQCAALITATLPLIMRSNGTKIDKMGLLKLSKPQFQALMFVSHHNGASLSSVAEHLGTTLSSNSKLIDGLVEHGFIIREASTEDRRRVTLAITGAGEEALDAMHQLIINLTAERLSRLSEEECSLITEAMELLQKVFFQPHISGTETMSQKGEEV